MRNRGQPHFRSFKRSLLDKYRFRQEILIHFRLRDLVILRLRSNIYRLIPRKTLPLVWRNGLLVRVVSSLKSLHLPQQRGTTSTGRVWSLQKCHSLTTLTCKPLSITVLETSKSFLSSLSAQRVPPSSLPSMLQPAKPLSTRLLPPSPLGITSLLGAILARIQASTRKRQCKQSQIAQFKAAQGFTNQWNPLC